MLVTCQKESSLAEIFFAQEKLRYCKLDLVTPIFDKPVNKIKTNDSP